MTEHVYGRRSTPRNCDVLVVGGGLVGLAACAFLAQQGLDVTLVERHPSTSLHPKARLINVRSMELYRSLGLEAEIRAAGEPNGGFSIADDLSASHEEWIPPADSETIDAQLSPVGQYSCDQQRIEPLLRDRAVDLGARTLFGTQASDIRQDEHWVTARLDHDGAASIIRARYLIAADGARSPIRKELGVELKGEAVTGTAISALFTADLSPALRGRNVDAFMARKAGAFLFARGNERERLWQLGTHERPEWGTGTEPRTSSGQSTRTDPHELRAHLVPIIRAATGLADLVPEIESVLTWSTGAHVAQRLSVGRIFLVGDAAHQMPPYGGFGGNTGVQDAHNLAWKLASLCHGDAGPNLLRSYETERHPLVRLIVDQALLRSRKTPGQPAPPEQIDPTTLTLGFSYPAAPAGAHDDRSHLVIPTSRDLGDKPTIVEDPSTPSGRPGTRAPHVGLHGSFQSTLDLLDPVRFTFIADHRSRTASELRDEPHPGITVRSVDPDSVDTQHRLIWDRIYSGPDCDGVLVRPDHAIAWRAPRHLRSPIASVTEEHARSLKRIPT